MAQLTPASNFPALFPAHIAQQEETLIFRGRQTGSSYDVSTLSGRVLFAVEPVPSLGRRTRVLDASSGKNIFCTRKKTFHLGNTIYFIEQPKNRDLNLLLTLEFKMFAIGTKFTAFFNENVIQAERRLCFERGYFSADGTITDGPEGPVIAHVERKIVEMLRKEYRVVVAQGVDVALITGLIVCLDDQEKSHQNAPALGGGRWG